jgi:hypothetical protein
VKDWQTWLQLQYRDGRWHADLSDEHVRRIFRPEAVRPDYWVNGPIMPQWSWTI